jgi:putative transposase
MEAISGRRTIQEIAADHAIELRYAAHLSVRPDRGESVEAPAAGGRQRAIHQRQEDQGQGRGAGQGGRAVPAVLLRRSLTATAAFRWSWSGSKKSLSCSDAHELRRLVDHDHPELSVSRQCALLGLPRSTLYYRPTPVRESSLRIMARIDAIYLEDPCSRRRRMVGYLGRDGIPISRDRVRNLMRRMGLRAIYQKPRTTGPGDPFERFPCLVDLSSVTAVDQVWATDITYISLQKGFLYLVAIVDLVSRNVYSFGEGFAYSWKLSNSLDTEFFQDALDIDWEDDRKLAVFHSEQGCQFTTSALMARMQAVGIMISWSGRKFCYDRIRVERLWQRVKYVAAGFSTKPSRALPALLQRRLGG